MLRATFGAFLTLNFVFSVIFWFQSVKFTSIELTTDAALDQPLTTALRPSLHSASSITASDSQAAPLWTPASGRKPNLVILGCVKDAAKDLPRLRIVIDHVLQDFQLVKMIFFENDSNDETVDILQSWNDERNGVVVQVVSEANVDVERTERLAHARNRLWQELQKDASISSDGVDFVLMMDMDEVNFHLAHVNQCIAPTRDNGGSALPDDWTVCCANQYTMHYDLLALRTLDDWVVDDVLHAYPPPNGKANIAQLLRHIPASADPIPTKSCFGGAALYKYPKIKHLPLGTMYSGSHPSSTYPICEHVNFHERIQQEDPSTKLYIQPKMMNDGPLHWRPNIRRKLQAQVDKSWADPSMERFYRTRIDYDDLHPE